MARGRLAAGLAALGLFTVLAGSAGSHVRPSEPSATDGSRVEPPAGENIRALSSLRLPSTGDLAFFDHGGQTGKHVYVGATTTNDGGCPSGVRVVDVGDPRRPRLVATAGGIAGVVYEDVEVRRIGSRIVLAVGLQPCRRTRGGGNAGLALYDVTKPSRPKRLAAWQSPWRGVHELDLVVRPDGRALALVATPHSERDSMDFHRNLGGDWRIIDVTDPRRPRQVSDWGIIRDTELPAVGTTKPIANPYAGVGGYAVYYGHSVRATADGMTAYVSYWDGGVLKFDIRDPRRPRLLARTGVAADEEGDAHSVTLLERGGRRFVIESREEIDPLSPPRVVTSATTAALPAVELSWAPTGLADTGPIAEAVSDAGRGCAPGAFAAAKGRIALVDQIDPSVPNAGKPLCDVGAQVMLAANAGARALLVNVTTGTRASIHRFIPHSRDAVDQAARGMPVVGISSLDGGADAMRARLRAGAEVKALLAATPRRWGGLAIYDDARTTPAPVTPELVRVGTFDDVEGVFGGGNGRPFTEGGTWYTSHNVELRGTRAYATWYAAGLVALDVTGAPKLRRVGEFAPAGAFFWGVDVDPGSQTVYATDRDRLWLLLPTGRARS